MTVPIALFVYNRLSEVARTFEALAQNELAGESELIVYSDSWKGLQDREKVLAVRDFVLSIKGFREVSLITREKHLGLSSSIISGVSDVIKSHGAAIVLEDDLVTSRYFLKFMNEGLAAYKNIDSVIAINGYMYPLKAKLPETFFLRGADCWGWATWKRGWDMFEADGSLLLREILEKKLGLEFDLNGAYPYLSMLKSQIQGRNDSWAVRWHALAFVRNKLSLYPGTSLVNHIGRLGTNVEEADEKTVVLADRPVHISDIPINEDRGAREKIEQFLKRNKLSFMARVCQKIHRIIQLRGAHES